MPADGGLPGSVSSFIKDSASLMFAVLGAETGPVWYQEKVFLDFLSKERKTEEQDL